MNGAGPGAVNPRVVVNVDRFYASLFHDLDGVW